MFVLFVCGVSALAIGLIGFLVWLGLRLFRVRKGRKVFKLTALAWLVVTPLLVFCVLPLVAATLIAHSGTRPMDLKLDINPETYGCAFQNVEFDSRDGVLLRGWWMPGNPEYPAFVVTHGLFRDRKEVVERACRLNQLGFGALAFDLRCHGKSEGKTVSMGYLERLDVLGACDWVREEAAGVIPLGVSMGASATIEAGPDLNGDVLALVADSPFLNLHETVDRHVGLFMGLPAFPFANFFIWNLTRLNHFQAGDLDAAKALGHTRKMPILLIYGKDDNRMPASTAEAVYEAIPHSMKEIVFFEGAGHGAAWRSDPERYLRAVLDFLSRMGVHGPPPGGRAD